MTNLRLFDLHCHLDFAENAPNVAAGLAARGIGVLSATVTPAGYERAAAALGECANVRVALGLHPWWLADGRCREADVERFGHLARTTRFIGEIGLDFAGARAETRDAQLNAFDRLLHACGTDKVLSIHAVRAAGDMLDALARTGCARRNACVLHWFSGTSDELQRARKLGCFFSVNPRMLASKRGRAYAQAIPANRLLLETDLPSEPASAFDTSTLEAALADTLARLAAVRSEDEGMLAARIRSTSEQLIG